MIMINIFIGAILIAVIVFTVWFVIFKQENLVEEIKEVAKEVEPVKEQAVTSEPVRENTEVKTQKPSKPKAPKKVATTNKPSAPKKPTAPKKAN
jgi:hypothetical protein